MLKPAKFLFAGFTILQEHRPTIGKKGLPVTISTATRLAIDFWRTHQWR
jgi:hypothetical protein